MARFLVVAPFVPHPARHGGAIRSRVLLDALRADHEVHFAAAVATDEDRANLRALAAEAGVTGHELAARPRPFANPVKKLMYWLMGGSELARRRWHERAWQQAQELVATGGFDRVIVDSTFALALVRWSFDVLFLHNLEYSMFARDDSARRSWGERLTRRKESQGLQRLERWGISSAPLTITVSARDRELAHGLAPNARVEVVPNSVDLDALPLLPLADPAAPPRLLFVGSLDYPPNLEAAVELVERHLPALRAAFPDLTVRLVGKDPRGVGARFRGVDGVEVVGQVDDLVAHYRDTHAVYLPIRSGGGTRIKILEAWALGVPVVTTAVGCEGLPADDAVRAFETPEEGVAALRQVLVGDGGRLRARGRELVEQQFSHRAAIARLRELIG